MAEPFYSYTQKEEFGILDRVKMLLVTKYHSNKTINTVFKACHFKI